MILLIRSWSLAIAYASYVESSKTVIFARCVKLFRKFLPSPTPVWTCFPLLLSLYIILFHVGWLLLSCNPRRSAWNSSQTSTTLLNVKTVAINSVLRFYKDIYFINTSRKFIINVPLYSCRNFENTSDLNHFHQITVYDIRVTLVVSLPETYNKTQSITSIINTV